MNKADGTKSRVDAAENVEHLGILSFEIDGNNGKRRFFYQLDDILRPWNVLDNLILSGGSPVLPFLPCGYFACREESQRFSFGDVAEGGPYACDTFTSSGREIVYRDEAVTKTGDHRQHKSSENPEIRSAPSDYRVENQTVYAPEMVVGDSEEPSFAGNELMLL